MPCSPQSRGQAKASSGLTMRRRPGRSFYAASFLLHVLDGYNAPQRQDQQGRHGCGCGLAEGRSVPLQQTTKLT